ncbi:DUF4190 domain-containing protein [Lachnospiraceae bacterium ZAX-1]
MSDNNTYGDGSKEDPIVLEPHHNTEGEQSPYGDSNLSYDGDGQGPQKGQGTGLGIASMVCGILSIVACCIIYLSIPLGIASIILGIVQIVKNEKRWMAITGIICSAVGIIASIGLIIVSVYLLSSGFYDGIDLQSLLDAYQ